MSQIEDGERVISIPSVLYVGEAEPVCVQLKDGKNCGLKLEDHWGGNVRCVLVDNLDAECVNRR